LNAVSVPKLWGFVLRPHDLRATAMRRFVFKLQAAAPLLEKPATSENPPAVARPLPPRRRR
jgi:hypothetical protein